MTTHRLLANTPLALLPDRFEAAAATIEIFDKAEAPDRDMPAPVFDGIAVIPICGLLIPKTGMEMPYWGVTGYDGVRVGFLKALRNPEVKAIVLDIDSYGGTVAGCFDLVDLIFTARGQKPIWAVLNECAYSAAYALASAADRIVVPRTGGTGSVGVIDMHCDISAMLSGAGVKVSLITYGALKADMSEFSPLTDAARARAQASVDTLGELFVNTVARNRGLSPATVRNTEAGIFLGADGVKIGFADAVMAPDEAFAALLKKLG